jgi:cyanophycinase
LKDGFGFLKNVAIATSKLENPPERGDARLSIERGAAIMIVKRWIRVLEGSVAVVYPASKRQERKVLTLNDGNVADLLTISRAALSRADESFPPKVAPIPEVPPGAMLVIGGSGISNEGTKRFIAHCGGVNAKIVVIPTALDDEPTREPYEVRILRNLGVKDVTVVRAKTRAEAETAEVLDPIRKATGIWFSGGRQWRLVDKYLGTSAEKEMHAVLARGGAIAGGSAGATIQGDYLVRGNPLGNVEMMVEGYERGLGFLKGVAIDQHFSQRKRFGDMTAFKKEVPHYLGIGIDENTALIVTGHVAEIVGEHIVSFYDKEQPLPEGAKDYTVVRTGESYDLKKRQKK